MADAVIYYLPDGRSVFHDPERVLLMPLEGGKVAFTFKGDSTSTKYKLASSLVTYQVNERMEVTGGLAEFEMERYDEGSTSSI